jgi:hypothetical protein
MTLEPASSGQLGVETATHRRVTDGTLFRPGPDGTAETFFRGGWVPAGWTNSDLQKSQFAPCHTKSGPHLGPVKKMET